MNTFARRMMVLGLLASLSAAPVSLALAAQSAPKAPSTQLTSQTAAEKTAQARARALVKEFYAVRLGTLWAAFTPEVKQQWGTFEGFTQYRQTGVQQFGAERELVGEKTFTENGFTFYIRSATFEKVPQLVWAVTFGFDESGQISEFDITLEHDRTDDQVALGAF